MAQSKILARRLWVYPSPINLKPHINGIRKALEGFLNFWKNEKNPLVQGEWQLKYDHFIIIFADESTANLSGCSIDSLQRQISQIGSEIGVDFLNRLIYFEDEGQIKTAGRLEFKELGKLGKVSGETWVYDTSLVDESAYESQGFRVRAKDSWHGKILSL